MPGIVFNIENQPIETASFDTLAMLYDKTKRIDTWFRDRYFRQEILLNGKDQVPVGEIKSYVPVAPLVRPKVQGRVIMDKTVVNVTHLNPAYLKPAIAVEPSDYVDVELLEALAKYKAIDSAINGQQTTDDAWQIAASQAYNTCRESIDSRVTLLCRDALLYGKIDVAGDDFGELQIDFGRHPDLTFEPLVKWGQPGATPYQDQKTMAKRLVQHGGKSVVDAIMSSEVFDSFVDDATFNSKFKTISPDTGVTTRVFQGTFGADVTAKLRGTVDGINYWTYDVTYEVEEGVEERIIPRGGFWFISEPRNIVYYCRIVHRLNPKKLAFKFFPYHVPNNNPSQDLFLVDSAPLPVPINKNGACGGANFI